MRRIIRKLKSLIKESNNEAEPLKENVDEIDSKNSDREIEITEEKNKKAFFKLMLMSFISPIKTYKEISESHYSLIIKSLLFFMTITTGLSYLAVYALLKQNLIKEGQASDYMFTIPLLVPILTLVPVIYTSLVSGAMGIDTKFKPYAKLAIWSLSQVLIIVIVSSVILSLYNSVFGSSMRGDAVNIITGSSLLFYFVISLSVSQKISIIRSVIVYGLSVTSIVLLYMFLYPQ